MNFKSRRNHFFDGLRDLQNSQRMVFYITEECIGFYRDEGCVGFADLIENLDVSIDDLFDLLEIAPHHKNLRDIEFLIITKYLRLKVFSLIFNA